MDFTVEEVNLMCVFDTSGRARLIRQLREALPDLTAEELKELAAGVIARLEKMSDEIYDVAKDTFYPEYGDIEDYEEIIADGGEDTEGNGSIDDAEYGGDSDSGKVVQAI